MISIALFLSLISVSPKSPQKAVLLSAVFPGGGQFYTGQYLKGTVLLAGEGVLIALTIRDYLDMKEADRKYQDTGNATYKSVSDDAFDRMLRDGFLLFGVWGLSLLDAFVSAQLYGFDEVDRSISIRGRPGGVQAGLCFRF
jgi:hypothetical protein